MFDVRPVEPAREKKTIEADSQDPFAALVEVERLSRSACQLAPIVPETSSRPQRKGNPIGSNSPFQAGSGPCRGAGSASGKTAGAGSSSIRLRASTIGNPRRSSASSS